MIYPKGQCYGWCELELSFGTFAKIEYCNCKYDWDKYSWPSNPLNKADELKCDFCTEPCGNDWCCMKDKK